MRHCSAWLSVCLIAMAFGFVGFALAGGIHDDFDGAKLSEDWIRYKDDAVGPQGTLELKNGQLVITIERGHAGSSWGREGLIYGPVDFTLGEVVIKTKVAVDTAFFGIGVAQDFPPDGQHLQMCPGGYASFWVHEASDKTYTDAGGGTYWLDGGFDNPGMGVDGKSHEYKLAFTPEGGGNFTYTFDFDNGDSKQSGDFSFEGLDPKAIYIYAYAGDNTSSGKTATVDYLHIEGPGVPGVLAVDASGKLSATWGEVKRDF